jgi:hypothetical protein
MDALQLLQSEPPSLAEAEASTQREYAAIMAVRSERLARERSEAMAGALHPSLRVIPRFFEARDAVERTAQGSSFSAMSTPARTPKRSSSSSSAGSTTPPISPLSSALRSSRSLRRTSGARAAFDDSGLATSEVLDSEEERRAILSDLRHIMRTDFLRERSVEILTQGDIIEIHRLIETLCAPLDATLPHGSQGDLDFEMFKQARALFVTWSVEGMVAPRAVFGDTEDDGAAADADHTVSEEARAREPITHELAAARAARKAQVAFAPTVFEQFPRDNLGRIESRLFLAFLVSYSRYLQARVHLALYDDDALEGDDTVVGSWRKARLHEDDLEQYIHEVIPALPSVQDLAEKYPNLLAFYVLTVMRHFLFFGTKRAVWLPDGAVSTTFSATELLASDSLRELLSLRYMGATLRSPPRAALRLESPRSGGSSGGGDGDGAVGTGPASPNEAGPMRAVSMDGASQAAAAAIERGALGIGPGSSCINSPISAAEERAAGWSDALDGGAVTWLMPQNTLCLWAIFHRLDSRKAGLLSQEDLRGYGEGCYTDLFWTRLYQEIETFCAARPSGDDGDGDDQRDGGERGEDGSAAEEGAEEGEGAKREPRTGGTQEMDYKTFVDLILALEYRHTTQALRFFWPLLDVKKRGCVASPPFLRLFVCFRVLPLHLFCFRVLPLHVFFVSEFVLFQSLLFFRPLLDASPSFVSELFPAFLRRPARSRLCAFLL